MKEYYVVSLPAGPEAASVLLNKYAAIGWRVVATVYHGGIGNGVVFVNNVILERDKAPA